MIEFKSKCIWKLILPGAFFFLALIAVSLHSTAAEILLSPPGLRLIKDPSLVIPADFNYFNRLMPLPAYRNPSGDGRLNLLRPAALPATAVPGFIFEIRTCGDPCPGKWKESKMLSDFGLSGPR